MATNEDDIVDSLINMSTHDDLLFFTNFGKVYRIKGYNVPEDISVIGFNNNHVSSYFYPRITTISQPSYDMGSVAMRMLIKLLNKKELEQGHYVLDYQLIQRESTK